MEEVAEPAAVGDGQHAWMQNAELRAHVTRAIQTLSPKLRDSLLLAQSGDYQYEDIAGILGVPLGTVKWRISEARRKVRETLVTLGYVDAK
jgi:RNA polymerase sigma-70 factor (ECF subfamily)